MSPRRRSKSGRRRNALIGGAATLVATTIALISIYSTGGSDDLIPPVPPGEEIVRIDLLASRDYETDYSVPAGGVGDNRPPTSVQTWTQTGGDRCYPSSDPPTTAVCATGGGVPWTVDATGLGWPLEPDAENKIAYSTAVDCSNWSCRGTASATTLQSAPDGTNTATLVTVGTGANDVYKGGSGYTNDAMLWIRNWVKCSTGTLRISNVSSGLRGLWNVDCSVVAGNWALINSTHPAVSEDYAWQATATGAAGVRYWALSGTVQVYVWAATLTETKGTDRMVIPTAAGSVSTGNIAWVIDNTSGKYYKAGDAVTQTITLIGGIPCWVVDGTDLRLSGTAVAPCTGILYALQVTK